MHKVWPGRIAHWVKYKHINNSDLDGMSLASFCQSRAVLLPQMTIKMCRSSHSKLA